MSRLVPTSSKSSLLRIPAATLRAAGLRVGDPITMRVEGSRIVIDKANTELSTRLGKPKDEGA